MKQKVILNTYSILVSTLGMAILIAVIVLELKQSHETAAYFGATGLVFLCVMALIYAPLSLSANDEKLNINRIIFPKSIPLVNIKSVNCVLRQWLKKEFVAAVAGLGIGVGFLNHR